MEPQKFGENLILIERLATGGMGEVFKAKQTGTGGFEKTVAVKRILPHFVSREDFAKRFQQEMWVASKLQHSNIAQVFQSGSSQDFLYLVMEYVNGKTLSELIADFALRNDHIPVEHVCFIISEAAKGLHYAHSLRDENTGEPYHLVHRDVSPQNIMCNENGEVKVLDFGIAKVMDNLNELSRADDVRGKLQYISPEQLEGKRATPQSDIFALGIVMYEVLTLKPLFLDNNTFQTITNIRELPIPSVVLNRRDVPEELEEILKKSLARDPLERYGTAQELHISLNSFLSKTSPSYSPTQLGQTITILKTGSAHSAASPNRRIGATEVVARDHSNIQKHHRLGRELKRKALMVGLAGILGVIIGYGYVAIGRLLQPGAPTEPVAIFVADDLAAESSNRIFGWKARSRSGEISFEQSSELNRPTLVAHAINNHAAVRFDGQGQFLVSPSVASRLTSSPDATFLLVARIARGKKGYIFSVQQSNMQDDVVRFGIDTGGFLRLKTTENPHIQLYYIAQEPLPGEFAIITLKLSGNFVSFFVNGRQMLRAQAADSTGFRRGHVMSLGQEFDDGNASDFLEMDLAELMIFDGAVDSYLQSLLEDNLATKYNLKVSHIR